MKNVAILTASGLASGRWSRHLARLHLFPPRNHHSLRCSWLQLTIQPTLTSAILDRRSPVPHRRLQRLGFRMASPITANWIRSAILLSLCLSYGGMLVSAQAPGVAPVPAPAASPVRFGPNVGGYRILRNGTVAMGGSIFPPQNCPPGSFAREITLTQDSTERLSSMSFRCSDPENTVITEVAGNGDPATGPQVTRTASVSEGTRGFSQVTGNTPYYMASDDTPIVAAISFRAADGASVSAGSTNFYNASVEQGAFTFNLSVITGFRGRKSLYFDTISLTFTN